MIHRAQKSLADTDDIIAIRNNYTTLWVGVRVWRISRTVFRVYKIWDTSMSDVILKLLFMYFRLYAPESWYKTWDSHLQHIYIFPVSHLRELELW